MRGTKLEILVSFDFNTTSTIMQSDNQTRIRCRISVTAQAISNQADCHGSKGGRTLQVISNARTPGFVLFGLV